MSTPTPLRVVIATRIFTPEPSAASFMLEAIATAFAAEGHQVTVLTTTPPAGLTPTELPGVTVRRSWALRDRQGYLRGYVPYMTFDIPLFFRLLFTRRADIYLVEPPPTTGAVVRVATAILRRPYVYDAADLWSDAAQLVTSSRLVLSVLRAVEVFAIRGAGLALAISDGLIDRMRELDIQTPATPIGFGVDTAAFRYEAPAATAQPYFLYAGSYSEWHGAGVFLEAFARFTAATPGHRLIFIGNGSDRPRLEARRDELGLQGAVEFRDPVTPDLLNPLLVSATASLASLRPGKGYDYAFTTKVYSSIAAGCPVIFSGVGPTVEFMNSPEAPSAIGDAVAYDVDAVVGMMNRHAAHGASAGDREHLAAWARERYSLDAIARGVVRAAVDIATA